MSYDEELADRLREALASHRGVEEKKMFGGIAFLLGGNMAVGVHRDEMIVRVSPEDHDKLVKEKGARTFDITGRPMAGWMLVGGAVLKNVTALKKWLARGVEYASSLPPKSAQPKGKKKASGERALRRRG